MEPAPLSEPLLVPHPTTSNVRNGEPDRQTLGDDRYIGVVLRDNLDELIADFDKMHGPADPEAVAAKRARLTGRPSTDAGAAA
ncbi:hypothetical protein [Streptomyces sp. NPDC096324]|uniref:hypothetical protein n=1 Tax=Streptomyces sp. NPDC096324 TaxID=3366085 RepID=UPI0038090CC5